MKRRDLLTGLLVAVVSVAFACGDSADEVESSAATPTTGRTDGNPDAGTNGSATTHGASNGGPSVDADSSSADCEPLAPEVVTETIFVTTSDDKELAGTVFRPSAGTCLPAVLLIHQYMRDRWQWGALSEQLAQRGYYVLAIDLRGHGDSEEQDGYLPELLTDPDQAPLDARAALEWLQDRGEVDTRRIGIVGTSIGAYLAGVAVVLQWGVDTIVAISPLTEAIGGLARYDEPIVLGDVYCIATEHDSDGAQARSCEQLVEAATGETRIEVFDDLDDHGVEILERHPELAVPIIEWLDETL
jgi:dienelactone hydrolase